MAATTETRSTCPYCGVGCGVIIQTQQHDGVEQIVGVRGDPDHPANSGALCNKGSGLHLTAQPLRQQQVRLLLPELRQQRDQARAVVNWDQALDHVADRFAKCIAQHGPDSVAFYISGQLLTEDYYVFNKLAKGLIGTNNVDSNSRLCMSSAVAGYKQSLGADAPPAAYEDIAHAHCLLITGSNTAFAHPILFRRIEAAKRARPELKIIVVDPRRTETAAFADLHLPILPGTDVALFHAMLNHMLWEGWLDRPFIEQHTEGFGALRAAIRDCTPAWAAQICGVAQAKIEQAAQWFAQSGATLSLYCQGLNQSATGTDNNTALINLHLATGLIGKAGTGPFSLTGQPNAMGGREVGGMANLLSAHRDLANPQHRAQVAKLWGVADVPATPGKSAVELFEALVQGQIRMVWIACTNPAQSMPDLNRVHQALRRAELVVVQEAYRDTISASFADVLLPASSWGEKEGTVTNSERRISRVRAAVPPPGLARHDWAIAAQFAVRLQTRLQTRLTTSSKPNFDYPNPEAVWNEHRESTAGRDLDITGLTYALLEARGPQQWPYPQGATQGAIRLYANGQFATANGRARFIVSRAAPVAEVVDARYPFALITGRLRDQWHGMSRTGTVAQSFGHVPEPTLEMNGDDLRARGLIEGDLVRVQSRRGQLHLPARRSDQLRRGAVFIAMHWGAEFLSGSGVNGLSSPAIDPYSKQPELKHCAVRIDKAQLPHRALLLGWLPADRVLAVRANLMVLLREFDYAVALLFGRQDEGVRVRLASAKPLNPELIMQLEAAFDCAPESLLSYDDRQRQTLRRIAIVEGKLRFFMLLGDQRSESWLTEFLEQSLAVDALGTRLLMASSEAPAGVVARGRLICSCVGVNEASIKSALREYDDVAEQALAYLQSKLGCGGQCGSCLPELRALIGSETCSTSD